MGVFKDVTGEFAEIYGGPLVARRQMFVIALMAITLAIGAVIFMFINAQKSVAMPWIVEVNATTGVVNKAVKIEAITPSQAIIKAELGRWATKIFTLDKYLTPKYLREANVMTKGLATNQFTEFRVAHKVYERIGKEVPVYRTVDITSVDTSSQPGMAFIFLTTKEATQTEPNGPVTRWRLNVQYELIQPKTESEILANALGLYVTTMNVSEEGASK